MLQERRGERLLRRLFIATITYVMTGTCFTDVPNIKCSYKRIKSTNLFNLKKKVISGELLRYERTLQDVFLWETDD